MRFSWRDYHIDIHYWSRLLAASVQENVLRPYHHITGNQLYHRRTGFKLVVYDVKELI